MKRRNLRPVSRRSLGQRHSFGVVALAALALAGCASGPPDSQTPARPPSSFAVPGLEKPAEVLVDRWGVPHLYAGTLYDAFVAQGFIAARDRLWQMDLWRKRGLGEMAKDFGPAWVENDRAARAVLYRGDMYREWLAYGSDAKRVAEAFTAGVNAYVAQVRAQPSLLPPEFALLGYQPAMWAPEDVVDGQLTIIVRDKAIPLFYLHKWLVRGVGKTARQDQGHVVIVQIGTQQVGFVVDNLIGQEEVVIKPLDNLLQGTPGMAGATITSDGGIALILDVPSLLKAYARRH